MVFCTRTPNLERTWGLQDAVCSQGQGIESPISKVSLWGFWDERKKQELKGKKQMLKRDFLNLVYLNSIQLLRYGSHITQNDGISPNILDRRMHVIPYVCSMFGLKLYCNDEWHLRPAADAFGFGSAMFWHLEPRWPLCCRVWPIKLEVDHPKRWSYGGSYVSSHIYSGCSPMVRSDLALASPCRNLTRQLSEHVDVDMMGFAIPIA